MQDLAAEVPPSAADEFEEEAAADGFEEEDAHREELEAGGEGSFLSEEGYEEGFEEEIGEGFSQEGMDAWESLEEAMADALDAYDTGPTGRGPVPLF
jgi:hypothetical protein